MKKDIEEILTKDNTNEDSEKNIRRVDNRPGSVFSIVIFAMVFLIGYLLYPQLSLLVPIPGNEVNVSTDYKATSIVEMTGAEKIIIAEVIDKGKTESYVASGTQPVVFRNVTFSVKEVIKGKSDAEFVLPEYGGSALFDASGKKEKFTVIYENTAVFEKGETYLLFISDGKVINGKSGAIKQEKGGTFTDVLEQKYSVDEIKSLFKEKTA